MILNNPGVKRQTMTSLGDKRKENADFSAKLTAANSYSSHRSRQQHQPSARGKTAQSVFLSDSRPNNAIEMSNKQPEKNATNNPHH